MSRPQSLVAPALVLSLLVAAGFAAADGPPADSRIGTDEAAIEKALADKTAFDFTGTPLSVVLEKLSKKHAIPIVIDRKALKKEGIAPDVLVTLHLSGVSLRAALNLLLRDVRCTWAVRDNALLITTDEEARKILATKVYPVEDIVAGGGEAGTTTDGSKALTDAVSKLLSLDDSQKVAGSSVHIVATKQGKGLSVTHNRWGQEDAADLLGQMRSAIRRGQSPAPQTAAEKRIKAALNGPTAIEFIEAPLEDVVDYLKKFHKIEIQIDAKSFADVGIRTGIPVTINVRGISLQAALRRLLGDLGLTYVVQGEVLLITAPEAWASAWVIQAYDVADLVTSHDQAGGVHYQDDALIEAISSHVERNVEITDVLGGWIGRFSNGCTQLLAARLCRGEDEETEWLLAEIRKVGRRRLVGYWEPAGPVESNSKRSRPLATVLPGEEAVQEALAQKNTFDFQNTPLTDVVDYLKDLFKIKVQIDHKALSDQGTRMDSPVTIKASHITLRAALKRILTPLELSWTIQDEVLLITISDEAEARLVTKVYAVDDLPDSDLPTKTDPAKDISTCKVVSSDAVRALVVTAPYAVQETIAAKLAALRTKSDRKTR